MNECDRCQRTYASAGEFEHGCEIATHDHGLVFVCGNCMHPGELGQWRERQLIEQIAERTIRRVLTADRATTARVLLHGDGTTGDGGVSTTPTNPG